MSEAGVLDGIRVLDLTWVGAGPLATKVFASFGAEVIKIESATRPDPLRRTPPFASGSDPLERSGYFADRNAGKRSISLDLSNPSSRDVVLKLAAQSDIVAQSFRPGTMERWGLGYEELVAVRPDLIYLAMPMQGESGPHASFSGFGATLVALCGLHDLCGYEELPPVGTGTNYPDHVPNPMHAVVAVLAALIHRHRTGEGQRIELSQLESTLNVIGPALEAAAAGSTPVRAGNRVGYAAPHGVFAADGSDSWLALAVLNDDQWRTVVALVGDPELESPALATLAGRKAHEDRIEQVIGSWTRHHDAAELARSLRAAGVPASEVRTADQLLAEGSDLRERGAFQWLDHPVMGRSVYTSPTPRLSRTPGRLAGPAPLLGADTDDVLSQMLGLSDADLVALRSSGALA